MDHDVELSAQDPHSGAHPPDAFAGAMPLLTGAKGLVRFLYNHNPFYVISALLVFHGLRISFLDGAGAYQTRSMIAGLMVFTLLLALTAWLVIKLGKVWNDARTLLVLVLLMFVAISVACDYSLADSLAGFNQDGIVNFLASFFFAVAVSEGLLWGSESASPHCCAFRITCFWRSSFFTRLPSAR